MARIGRYQTGRSFSLYVREPVITGNALRDDESRSAYEWERTIALDGSAQGSFALLGSEQVAEESLNVDGFTTGELTRLYRELLGCDVVEAAGGDYTYRGLIWRLTLSTGRRMKTRSLDSLCNDALVRYQSADTVWLPIDGDEVENVQVNISRRRFGRKQCILDNDIITTAADAERYALRYLETHAYAYDQRAFQKDRPMLGIETIGYQYLFNWLYGSLPAGLRVDQALVQIISDFNALYGYEIFQRGQIDDNGVTLSGPIEGTFRDMINIVTQLQTDDRSLWQFWVDERLRVHFQPVSFRPEYIENDSDSGESGIFTSGGQWLHSRRIEPRRVVRDTTYPSFSQLAGSPYLSEQDALIEEITVYSDDSYSMQSLDLTQTPLWGIAL